MTSADVSSPKAQSGMLIRRPVAQVFQAFIDPEITSKFWFTRSTGKLEEGREVQWYWDMYNAAVRVVVKEIEPNRRILVTWGNGQQTAVEWQFMSYANNSTFVTIVNDGFEGSTDEVVKQALDSLEGFTLVLAGLKAWLEHGILLNLIADRFPSGLEK